MAHTTFRLLALGPVAALATAGCAPKFLDPFGTLPSTSDTSPTGGHATSESSSGSGDESTSDGGSTSTGDDTGDDSTGVTTGPAIECEQGVAWVRVFPSDQPEHDLRAVAVDDAGNAVAVGDFTGAQDLGLGPIDEADGKLYIAKFGPDGGTLWVRQFGTGTMRAQDVVIDGDGDIIVVARHYAPVDLGGGVLPVSVGGPGSFVAKFTGDGEHVWSRAFVSEDHVTAYTVDVAADGAVVATMASNVPVDFGDGPIGAEENSFVVRLDPDGAVAWARAFFPVQQSGSVYWPGAAFAADGEIAVIVRAQGLIELGAGPQLLGDKDAIHVVRLSPAGTPLWVVGSTSDSIPFYAGVRTDDADRIHVAGEFAYSLSFGGPDLETTEAADAYAAVLAGDGSHVWSDAYGAGELAAQGVTSLDVLADGRRALTGAFAGSIDFGGGAMVAAPDQQDGFVAVQGPLGEPLWSRSFPGNGQFFAYDVALHPGGDVWLGGKFDGEFVVGDQVFVNGPLEYAGYLMRLCDADG